MFNCNEFYEYLAKNNIIDDINEDKQPILYSIINYIQELDRFPLVNSYNYICKPFNPKQFYSCIKDERFSINNSKHLQQDAHEFLLYLLSQFEIETKKIDDIPKKNEEEGWIEIGKGNKKSIIINNIEKINSYSNDIFQITLRNELNKSSRSGQISYEYLYCLTLPIVNDNIYTIEDALYYFMMGDKIEHEDKKLTQKYKFEELPPILFINIMRFNYLKEYDETVKIIKPVEYKNNLKILPEYLSPNLYSKYNGIINYKLRGIICHIGESIENGHYICYINDINHLNYLFNDTQVRCVNNHQYLDNSTNNYILCYSIQKETK